jgi:hypothetical protein
MNWIGHINEMDSERKVSHIFNSNPQESRLWGPKTGGGFVYKQILINAK